MLTYNREQYVSKAVESILNQTFVDFEFILVNNGSEDSSGEICDSYAKADSRISVIHKKKGNIGSGRNAGLMAAQGEFVAFIDDDDTAEPDMLEFLYNLIAKYNADISICGSWRSTDGVLTPKYVFDEVLELNTEQAIVELLKRKFYNVGFPTKMFRRTLLLLPPFSEQGQYDDITTAYKIFAAAKNVVVHCLPKYTAYRHEKNNSSFSVKHQLLKPYILDEYLTAYRERTEWLSERLPVIEGFVRYSEWSFMISMCEKIKRYEIAECKTQFDYMRDALTKNREVVIASQYMKGFERDWFKEIMVMKAPHAL